MGITISQFSQDSFELLDKVAIVTGAASGIGKATALALMRMGVRVVLVDINELGVVSLYDSIIADGGDAVFAIGDVANEKFGELITATAMEAYGRIDILVNNAGIEYNDRGNIVEMPWEDACRIMDVNLKGYMLCARSVIPQMLKGREDVVVNVSSIQAVLVRFPGTSYQVSKAGIEGLTRVLAVEYGHAGIRTNCVRPGAIATEGMGATRADADPAAQERLNRMIPLGRQGTPEEVADVILFLCSKMARYMNGSIVTVDGGWLAGAINV